MMLKLEDQRTTLLESFGEFASKTCVGYNDFLSTNDGWEVSPVYNRDGHYTLQSPTELIYFKPVDGDNELFNELVVPPIYNLLGIQTYKSGVLELDNVIGAGTTALGTRTFIEEDYSTAMRTSGKLIAGYFVASCFVANHDWGRCKYDNYTVSESKNGSISEVFQIDFGQSLLGPEDNMDKVAMTDLLNCSLTFLDKENEDKFLFFGIEACKLHPKIVVETLVRIENLDLSKIKKILKTSAEGLVKLNPGKKAFYRKLVDKSYEMLANRQKRLRFWLIELFEDRGLSCVAECI